MPLVSIVIPAYKQARYVGRAVRSALEQTHPWVDIVVVDDGSPDETWSVLREFRSHVNVTVIRQPNAGLPAARNRGLREARGEFVCFLDSDDYLAPMHIERLLAPLVTDPELACSYCDVQMVDEHGAPSGDFSVGQARRRLTGDIFDSLLIGGYFPPHTVLVRRSVIDDSGAFDTALGGHADYELWLRIAALGHPAHYVDERLAYYRVYEGSMSTNLEHMRQSRMQALERVAAAFPSRVAASLSAVQELSADLHTANAWLRTQWEETLARLDARAAAPRWALADRVHDAVQTTGEPAQFAVWDVPGENGLSRCLFLHPPAALRVSIPTGNAGTLSLAVALHPDVWTNPEASGAMFSATVDDTIVGGAALDPLTRPGDRRWVALSLDVPASTTGAHVLTLETRIQGTGFFAWALFKDVEFRSTVN